MVELGIASAAAFGALKEPIRTLCGPAWNQLAGAWGDKVQHWRDMRKLELVLDTVQKLKEKGISPQAVAPELLHPILDAGSLPDDENLRGKWINLLARAATPDKAKSVLPAFTKILAELSPFEVLLLDDLSAEGDIPEEADHWEFLPVEVREGVERLREEPGSPYYAPVYESNFMRLGLISKMEKSVSEDRVEQMIREAQPQDPISQANFHVIHPIVPEGVEYFFFTPLGLAFIAACKEP